MRHRLKGKTLDRKKGPRESLLRNLVGSLVLYEKIRTTKAKAKAIQPLVEKFITISKNNTLAVRRQLMRFFYTENEVKKLLEVLGPRFKDRKGGYSRIVKVGRRLGDGAEIVQIELL